MKKLFIFLVLCFIFFTCPSLYAIDFVNEKSTSKLTMTFTDEDGNAVTPSSGTYKIDDMDSGTAIKAETGFTPSSPAHSIIITSTENRILDQNKAFETRRITITFTYTGKTGTGDYLYRVKNLAGIQ